MTIKEFLKNELKDSISEEELVSKAKEKNLLSDFNKEMLRLGGENIILKYTSITDQKQRFKINSEEQLIKYLNE